MTFLINTIRTIIMPIALLSLLIIIPIILLFFSSDFNYCFIFSIVPIYNVSKAPITAIVVFGTNLQSTVGKKLKPEQLAIVKLAPYQYSVIIGLLLSDGWLIFASKTHKNARLGFAQSGAHSEYFWFVFLSLSHFCSSYPRVRIRSFRGKETIGLEFSTRSMPCMTELHSLFYSYGVKIVPHNIFQLLTPVVLAHIIMGDGSVKSSGLILCTDSYTVQDVVRLINVLMIKYRLDCWLRNHTPTQPRIYISQSSMPLLLNIVSPFMHPSMLYKLKSALSNPSNRQKIEVFDKDTNQTTYYDSINKAATALDINHARIVNYFSRNQKKPYKGRYIFKKVN